MIKYVKVKAHTRRISEKKKKGTTRRGKSRDERYWDNFTRLRGQ